jgi:class 3 adenylate cyclase
VGGHTLADIAFLAACHGGEVDPCPEGSALVRFENARAAFNMAVEMQQSGVHPRFQVGLATGACTVACLALDDGVLRVLLGDTVERAGSVARHAAPGSIRIAPETFGELQEQLVDVSRGVLTTEYEQESMIAVSLTPTPHSTAHLSTFAGLGLT